MTRCAGASPHTKRSGPLIGTPWRRRATRVLPSGRRWANCDDPPNIVLLDCLTLLANNVLITLPEDATEAAATAALMEEVDELLATWDTCGGKWIVVSNEVGLGIVPAYPLGRLYRDALGRANQRLAAAADTVVFMVAGIPMRIKG